MRQDDSRVHKIPCTFFFIFYDGKIHSFCNSLSKRFATQKYYRGSTVGESIVLVKGILSAGRLSARDIIPFYLCPSRNADSHFANESR